MTFLEKLINNKKILYIGIGMLLLLLALILFLTSKNDETHIPGIKEDLKQEEKEEKKVSIVDEKTKSRPFAVMINNAPAARPLQSGLQDAYIIYEIIVEGGLTRYLALFLDQTTSRIGSIRSSRHYFLDYALENDAIYVHHGQSPQAQSDFSKLGIDRIVADNSKTGWRDKTLNVASEHTLFTSIDKLTNGIKNKRTERKNDLLLNYSAEDIDLSKITNSQVANNVLVKYSESVTSTYEYDAENQVYKRSVNGKAHKDYVTKEQYTFKNIIAYSVENYNINDGSGKGRQEINNIGTGEGYYISNGYATKITWTKKDRSSQTVYKYASGEEIKVNDGNTFIQIYPKGKSIEIN